MSLRILLQKDARRELRSKESLQAGLVLVGLFFVLYLFALTDVREAHLGAIALWTPLLYATAALTGRGWASEADRGTLDLLRLWPVPGAMHGLSRTLVDLLLVAALAAVALALAVLGFRLPYDHRLLAVLGLAAVGLTTVGSLAGALAAQARARSVLLPILLIPVAAPLVQSGVRATMAVLAGTEATVPLMLMAGYDLIVGGVVWLLWPHVLEAD